MTTKTITLRKATEAFFISHFNQKSDSTKDWYVKKLNKLAEYIGPLTPLSQITEIHLDMYVSHLYSPQSLWANNPHVESRSAPYSPTTIKNHIVAVKTLFRWLRKRRYISHNPAEVLSPPLIKAHPIQPVPADHIDLILEYLTMKHKWRDRAVIKLVATTGIRSIGVASIGRADISIKDRWVHVIEKRGTERTIPFGDETAQYLADYVTHRPLNTIDSFFLSRKNRLTEHGFRQMLRRTCKAIKLPIYGPHQLRHSFATTAVHNGCGELWLQLMLGHEIGSKATKVYVKSDLSRLRPEYDRLFKK